MDFVSQTVGNRSKETEVKDETTKKVEEVSGGGIKGKTDGLNQNKML